MGGLLVAVCVAACGDELPMAGEAERAESVAEERQAAGVAESSATQEATQPQAETGTTAPQADAREQRSDAAAVEQTAEAQQTEPASQAVEQEAEAVEEQDSAEVTQSVQQNLTDIPAVVLVDADVRVRPGLSWPIKDRLSAGASALVLNEYDGWLRIVYGDDLEGWIRSIAVDLGEIEERQVLFDAAPTLWAEWRGHRYGVTSQTADAAEVVLYRTDGEETEYVHAAMDEVTLLSADVALKDLPIRIGEETVVFSGDDFRAGQGRILPKADEWMWLPWGWLLAHNEEYIWQWRPETDELEFIRRPPGPASLSPSGQHIAILARGEDRSDWAPFRDVIVVPLDGGAEISLRQQFDDAIAQGQISPTMADYELLAQSGRELHWSPNGETIAVRLYPGTWETYVYPALLSDMSGAVTALQGLPDGIPPGLDCWLGSLGGNTSLLDWWWLRDDNTFVIYGLCANERDGAREDFDIVFSLNGEFLGIEPFSWNDWDEASLDLVRSAQGGELLGEWITVQWSQTRRYALVIDRDKSTLHSYDPERHQLGEFWLDSRGAAASPAQELELDQMLRDVGWHLHWDVYWYDGQTAAAIARWSETIVAGFILDLAERSATALELGPSVIWPCQRTGSWRPDGSLFQLSVGRRGFQLMAFESNGRHVGDMRVVGHPDWAAAPLHQAEWSPNGEWFAIGGDPLPTKCIYGP